MSCLSRCSPDLCFLPFSLSLFFSRFRSLPPSLPSSLSSTSKARSGFLQSRVLNDNLWSSALFLATRLMRAHHISSILWEVDLIGSHIGAPQLSMPRRQSMLLVFEFARLVPFVAPNVVGSFLANPQSTFRIRKAKLFQKMSKKNYCLRRQNWFMFQNKNPHDAHQIFDQSTLEMVTYVFLSVKCTKYV